jgi:hypothetical protein
MPRTIVIGTHFLGSMNRLTKEEHFKASQVMCSLHDNLARPGYNVHPIKGAKDAGFHTARVNRDVRMVVHITDARFTYCYVAHHDDAYKWAQERTFEVNSVTGSIQIVVTQEIFEKRYVPTFEPSPSQLPPPCPLPRKPTELSHKELLAYGIPEQFLPHVCSIDNEDELMDVCQHLPEEAGEALMDYCLGTTPRQPVIGPFGSDPLAHPDSLRRFYPVKDGDGLTLALTASWEKWVVFLHPDQRDLVERCFSGPARVTGTAGTGKTVVAVHRAVHLARRDSDAHVLLTTFSDPLANLLRSKVRMLASREPRVLERVEIVSLDSLAKKMFQAHEGTTRAANRADVQRIIESIVGPATALHSPLPFVLGEWEHVVDAWQLQDWESYRDVARLGRKTRLPEDRRMALWGVFSEVRQRLAAGGMQTLAGMYGALTGRLRSRLASPFTHAVVDEAQDISVAQLRFLSALVPAKGDSLFFAGDLGQRIFQQPFSWLSLGVDVRGRSRNLRINYRMSHQIRTKSDRLLDKESVDADGNASNRTQTISVFQGTPPRISTFASTREEAMAVTGFIRGLTSDGYEPHEIAVIVRSDDELVRATGAVAETGLEKQVLDGESEPRPGRVAVATMHLAKGLEFRAVIVMACDEDTLPLRSRIEGVGDQGDLEEVYSTERHLLYVACTRARDQLLVTGVQPASEFLDDMR